MKESLLLDHTKIWAIRVMVTPRAETVADEKPVGHISEHRIFGRKIDPSHLWPIDEGHDFD